MDLAALSSSQFLRRLLKPVILVSLILSNNKELSCGLVLLERPLLPEVNRFLIHRAKATQKNAYLRVALICKRFCIPLRGCCC